MTGCPCGCAGPPGGVGPDGCCAGVQVVTPLAAVNRPGLPAISYRPGRHGDFLESMIARLASRPELVGYTTRDPGDPGIALLDCWALAADIVGFYAERAANEGFLGTATLPDSLGYLARLVDYQPRPAVGASGYLAFTMDPGSAGTIPAGAQARSIAAQGQPPQTFETAEAIVARSDWNQLAPRMTMPGGVSASTLSTLDQLTLAGAALGLQPGTRLLFDFGSGESPGVRVVTTVVPDVAAGTTAVRLVPAGPVGLDAARSDLVKAIRAAISDPPPGQFAQAVVTILLTRPPEVTREYDRISLLIRQLTEAQAIGAGRVPPDVAAWLAGPGDGTAGDALAKAASLLRLLAADGRRLPPDVEYLRGLAEALVSPPGGEEGRVPVPDATLDRAVPLVAAAAIVPALRRPPSAPPATPAALPQSAPAALGPSSTVISALLGAADPRLAGLLGPAVSQQAVTAPAAVGTVIALKVKASALPGRFVLGTAAAAPGAAPAAPGVAPGAAQPAEAAPPGGAAPHAAAPPLSPKVLVIDGTPDSLIIGSWLVCEQVINTDNSTQSVATRVTGVQQGTRVAWVGPAGNQTSITVPTSIVTLADDAYDPHLGTDGRLTAYFGGVPVPLADEPVTGDVGGSRVTLAHGYDGLYPGQRLIVTGERTDVPGTAGVIASELTMVGGVENSVDPALPGDVTLPVLVLAVPLAYTYKRDTVTISGNVAAATQGETRTEVLGSGAAGTAGQSFPLRQVSAARPLTWLPSDNALGAASTLTVRVNGVAWPESADLTQAGPGDHAYRAQAGSDGVVTVAFGDGVHGSRLPTGQQNVTAAYRTGGGSAGNVAAGRITQLASRPLGVNAVTNPLPSTGGADGDGPAAVRGNAALRCQALDRLVSVQDYADFTAARAGIGKAAATRISDGTREVVHVTIVGAGDAPLDESDLLVTSLREALAELGDPFLPVLVGVREALLLVLSAGVNIDPAYSWDLVEPAVRAAALAAAGFEAQDLGQPVYLSAVVAAMQAVSGVQYVDVDLFTALPATANPVELAGKLLGLPGSSAVAQVIEAKLARYEPLTYTTGQDPVGDPDTLTRIALRHGTTVAALAALNPGLAAVRLAGHVPPQLTGVQLLDGMTLTVSPGIRPAQLAMMRPDVPQALILRSIP